MTKKCKQCNKEKELTDFYHKNKQKSKQLHAICKSCFNLKMKPKYDSYKSFLLTIKGNCCEKCGYNKCPAALEFHHLDPNEKEFSVSKSYSYSREKIIQEIQKCQLLCANCHREVHNEGV